MKAVFELGPYRVGIAISEYHTARFQLLRPPHLWEAIWDRFHDRLPEYRPIATGWILNDLTLQKPRVLVDDAPLPTGVAPGLLYRWRTLQQRFRKEQDDELAEQYRKRSSHS